MRWAFEEPGGGASLPEIKQDMGKQHVSCILKTRLDQASSQEDNLLFQGGISERGRETKAGRPLGHRDRISSSCGLEHRVQEEVACKVNCKGKLRLNTRRPP